MNMKRQKGKGEKRGSRFNPAAAGLLLPPTINRGVIKMLLRILLPSAFCLLPFAFTSAQSGRQTQPPPRLPSMSQHEGQKPAPAPTPQNPPPPQDTRPRRATEEPPQDDSPIKLSASLVTVIT